MPAALLPVRILVVDDDPSYGAALRRELSDHGLECAIVTDWASAIEAVEMHSFDAVLANATLRGRQTGVDLLEEVAARAPLAARVRMAAVPSPRAGRGTANHAFLTKPFAPKDLLCLLASMRGAHA